MGVPGRRLTADIRSRLRWVKAPAEEIDLARFPDFLIVGPQRTGTTWLHANLRLHPDVMLSEPKEILFFNRLKQPEHAKFQSDRLDWYLQFFREPLWRAAAKTAYCLRHYRRLYWPKVSGEASASYAALDADVIDEIVALNPEVRVMLMIRDPVERAWSHAKKDLVRNRKRKFEDVSEEEFRAFFTDEYQLRCAQYVRNMDTWQERLQPGHLFVGVFDDVASRPEALLREAMEFLGIDADDRFITGLAREEVNPAGGSRIPEKYRKFLKDLFAEDRRALQERLGLVWPKVREGEAPAEPSS